MKLTRDMSCRVETFSQLTAWLESELAAIVPDKVVKDTFPSQDRDTLWRIEVSLRPYSSEYKVHVFTGTGLTVYSAEQFYGPDRMAVK